MIDQATKDTVLEIQVNAALAGHDLGPFESAETLTGGYQARCRRCGRTVWVGDNGLMYSLLGDKCASPQNVRG